MITGSFNLTKAAEERNAENLHVLKKAPELAQAYDADVNAHAAHSHPYRRTTAEATPTKENQLSFTGEKIHGNRQSKVYHLPGCPGYERMSPANVVSFASEAKAIQPGYRRAKNCP